MIPNPNFKRSPGGRGIDPAQATSFVEAISALYEDLRSEEVPQQLPDWASTFCLPGESELITGIADTNVQIAKLREEIEYRTADLEELCRHKLLFTGHDSALEAAVDRVLTNLGMHVEPGKSKRVDRTATYGEKKFAIEVQGTKKGAKEDHVRALNMWVSEVGMADGKDPKGLLVVNAFRETPLSDRGSVNPWPGASIEKCERYGYCAITGLQLLGLYLDAKSDETKREKLIEVLFQTDGRFEGYEDWTVFLEAAESPD